jgi:hypothetical protein
MSWKLYVIALAPLAPAVTPEAFVDFEPSSVTCGKAPTLALSKLFHSRSEALGEMLNNAVGVEVHCV